MNTVSYKKVHPFFKLNGYHLDKEDLCRVAYSFIKEGEEFESVVGEFVLDWFDSKSYLEMTTSGTTGAPKTIRIQKQAMVNSAIATGNFLDLQPGNKTLHCLPVKYIAGKMMLVRGFVLGLDIDFVEPSSHPMRNKADNYDFVAMVPLQVQNSLSELKNVKKLIVGGAKMSSSLEKDLSKLKTNVYETYGMTETITHIAVKKLGEKIFSVLPNVSIGQDKRNCLIIDAPMVVAEQVVTNDLVELISETQFVLLGRIDHVVNSGGIKLIPEQIEEKLSSFITARFFVAGIPDLLLGEKLVLIIEGEQQGLDRSIFESLEKYEKPKEIIYVPKFLETHNGKVKRNEILSSIQ
jgi:O-succinylbenzoic acid--CoA ligase